MANIIQPPNDVSTELWLRSKQAGALFPSHKNTDLLPSFLSSLPTQCLPLVMNTQIYDGFHQPPDVIYLPRHVVLLCRLAISVKDS